LVDFEPSPQLEVACNSAGVGLLRLTDDNSFEMVLNYDDLDPGVVVAAFESAITEVRRSMERAYELNRRNLELKFGRMGDLTSGMAPDMADKYSENIDRQYRLWDEWSEAISTNLDAIHVSKSEPELDLVRKLVSSGPTLDDDV